MSQEFAAQPTESLGDDAALIQALNPLLTGQSLTLTITLDAGVPGSSLPPGDVTLYRAVTASSARFAGFDPGRTTLFTFAVSGALAGLAGDRGARIALDACASQSRDRSPTR